VEVAITDGRLRPLFKLVFYDLDRLDISRRIIRAALARRGIDLHGLFWVFRGMALRLDEPAADWFTAPRQLGAPPAASLQASAPAPCSSREGQHQS
jgi:hypothetical protein